MRPVPFSRYSGPALLAAAAIILGACASGEAPRIDDSPDAELTFDGLAPVLNSRADLAWARPGLDLSGYTKVKLQGAGIEYRPGGESGRTWASRSRSSGPFEVTPEAKERFQRIVQEVFLEELSNGQRYAVVDEAGPDVLLVRGALLDVVSFVPPDTVTRTDVFLRRVGEATLVIELRDSITEAILARMIDRRAADRPGDQMMLSNTVTNQAEARRLARRWAVALREALDEFMGGE